MVALDGEANIGSDFVYSDLSGFSFTQRYAVTFLPLE